MERSPVRTLLVAASTAALPIALALTLTANIGFAGDNYGKKKGDPYLKKSASVEQLFVTLTQSEECTPAAEHTCGDSCTSGWKASEMLGGMIVKSPESFDEFAPLFRASFDAAETSSSDRDRLLSFLGGCSSKSSARLGEELYATTPAAFGDQHVVAFAAMGSKKMNHTLYGRVEQNECSSIVPAAYLAFHGKDVGRKSLVHAVKMDLVRSNVDDALLAAAALDCLDPEGAFVQCVRERVHTAALKALDAGDLATARDLAVAALVVTQKLQKHEAGKYGFPLNNLDTEVSWTLRKKAETLTSADQVFEVIEEIRPIS